MEFKEGIHKSSLRGTLFVEEPEPDPSRKQRTYVRWVQVLIVLVLVVCLVGGVFVYMRFSRNAPTVSATNHTGWCVSTGAALNPQAGTPFLSRLTAISPGNVWMLGSVSKGDINASTQRAAPLVEHWDGTQWSTVATADTAPLLNSLLGKFTGSMSELVFLDSLAVVSTDDMWAVGSVSVSQLQQGNSLGHTLIEHWDGHQWQVVASPDGAPQESNRLTSIVAISANDIWAVGSMETPAVSQSVGPTSSALVEHWDGSHWSVVPLPVSLQSEFLNGVTATSADDVWAVGAAITTGFANNVLLAVHWDGHSWSAATLPPTLNLGYFLAVKATSASDVWAVGTGDFRNPSPPIVAHWDGTHWSKLENIHGAVGSYFFGLAADGSNNVWTVGDAGTQQDGSSSLNRPLVEHWNGQTWSSVALPNLLYGNLSDVATIGNKVWIVGANADATGKSIGPLIETKC